MLSISTLFCSVLTSSMMVAFCQGNKFSPFPFNHKTKYFDQQVWCLPHSIMLRMALIKTIKKNTFDTWAKSGRWRHSDCVSYVLCVWCPTQSDEKLFQSVNAQHFPPNAIQFILHIQFPFGFWISGSIANQKKLKPRQPWTDLHLPHQISYCVYETEK